MAVTGSGVRSPSPPLSDWGAGGSVRRTDAPRYAGVRGQVRFGPSRGNSSVGRAQPCQGWGRGFESRFPLWHSDAGWSSLVARRAHNPEVVGSNPTPATTRRVDGETGRRRAVRRAESPGLGSLCPLLTTNRYPSTRLSVYPSSLFGRLAQLVRAPR